MKSESTSNMYLARLEHEFSNKWRIYQRLTEQQHPKSPLKHLERDPLDELNIIVESINSLFDRLHALFQKEEFLRSLECIYTDSEYLSKHAQSKDIEEAIKSKNTLTNTESKKIIEKLNERYEVTRDKGGSELKRDPKVERQKLLAILGEARLQIGDGLGLLLNQLVNINPTKFESLFNVPH